MDIQKIKSLFPKLLAAGALCSFTYVTNGACMEVSLPENYTYLGVDYASKESGVILGRCRTNSIHDNKIKCFCCKNGKVSVIDLPNVSSHLFKIKGCNQDASVIYISYDHYHKNEKIIPVVIKESLQDENFDFSRSHLQSNNLETTKTVLGAIGYDRVQILKDGEGHPYACLLLKNNEFTVAKINGSTFCQTIQKPGCSLILSTKNSKSLFVDTHEGPIFEQIIEFSSCSRTKNREIFICTPEKKEVVLTRKNILGYLGDELYEDVWYPSFSYQDKFLFCWYRCNHHHEISSLNNGIKYFVKEVGGHFMSVQEFLQKEAGVTGIKLIHDLFLLNDMQTVAFLATSDKEETKLYLLSEDEI